MYNTMRVVVKGMLLIAAIMLGVAPMALADSSADKIKNCPDGDWCSYHRTVDTGWRHSPLAEISTKNVKNLHPAWIFQPGEVHQGLQSTPLVIDGEMYVATNPSTVWKLPVLVEREPS